MYTTNLKIYLAMAAFLLVPVSAAPAKYSGGTGEPNDPYRIATAEDLNDIGNHPEDLNKCFLMVNDINLAEYTGTQFNIIGDIYTPFTGVFDGNDHKIWNFTWSSDGIDYIGLFGYLGSGGIVKKVRMDNINVKGGGGGLYIGSLIGYNHQGTIADCCSIGTVTGGFYVGGLIGYSYGDISNCCSAGAVIGYKYVGGLVGYDSDSTITNCHSLASVSGEEKVGGLVGYDDYYGMITNCYSTGSVSGEDDVGGLVGYNDSGITNCYATGTVSGGEEAGGLVGWNNIGMITNCYSTGSVSGTVECCGGLVGYSHGTISSCYSSGNVSGTGNWVGGLVGANYRTISNCYSTSNILGYIGVGGIAGYNYYTINNCYFSGSVSGDYEVGGLVGCNGCGTVSSCYSSGSVSGYADVGGLVGLNWDVGTISECHARGTVSGVYSVGGLVGNNQSPYSKDKRWCKTTNCYSWGSVSGYAWVGGLVGHNEGKITNCYSTGSVLGDDYVGGLVGANYGGTVVNSFWDVNTSVQSTSAGGTGKTTAEMKTLSTFTSAGWDFVGETTNGPNDIWRMCVDDVNYPLLSWQLSFSGDFACPDGIDFVDFAVLGLAWRSKAGQSWWNLICDISVPKDNMIDERDLEVFCEHWLEGIAP